MLESKKAYLIACEADGEEALLVQRALGSMDGVRLINAEAGNRFALGDLVPAEFSHDVRFILLASPASLSDEQTLFRLGMAWGMRAPIIAITTRPGLRLPPLGDYRAVISLPVAKHPGVLNDLFDELAKVV